MNLAGVAAAWIVYAFIVTLLLGAAALTAEHALLSLRRPSRWVWAAAMLASIAVPLAMSQQVAPPAGATAIVDLATSAEPIATVLATQSPLQWVASASRHATSRSPWEWAHWEWIFLAAWAATSAALLAGYICGAVRITRRLSTASAAVIEGTDVLITQDVGPAVFGLLRPQVVLPSWLTATDSRTQSMVVAHESEHLAARDAQLFGAALLLAMLVPWNLPLWWQLRRLRLALETDCDARVVRRGQDAAAYGRVLLEVAIRLGGVRMRSVALSESASALEQRIRRLKRLSAKSWKASALLFACGAVALAATAANIAPPAAPAPTEQLASSDELPRLPSPASEQNVSQQAIAAAVAHFHPQLMAGKQDGFPRVWFVTDRDGAVVATSLDFLPRGSADNVSPQEWAEHLRAFGIEQFDSLSQVQMQARIGSTLADVLWVVEPNAAALDPAAPRLQMQPQPQPLAESVLRTAAAQRIVIDRFDAGALASGVPAGWELWFLMNADGRVLQAGRRQTLTDPEASRAALQAKYPGIKVSYVTRGTAVKDGRGKRLPVSWHWLEYDSPAPL